MYSLLEAMDAFNALAPEEKGPQRSWLDFANIKRWSREVNAALDATLSKNDVIVPSSIGLDLYEDQVRAPEQKWTTERRVSGGLWRCKSSPPPETGSAWSCLDWRPCGTPEGCSRWSYTVGFGELFWSMG
jgi:hypothetical protein